MYFKNRSHAGKLLADKLSQYRFDSLNTIVLALPRGGVPVAYEISKSLNLPLDLLLVKKISTPEHPSLAIGAISESNDVVYNLELMKYFGYDLIDIEPFKMKVFQELLQQGIRYRGGGRPLSLENKDIILVDDGIATGSTMSVVIQTLIKKNIRKIIIAVPVVSPDIMNKLLTQTDKIITLISPEYFSTVGQWFEDFSPVNSKTMTRLLNLNPCDSERAIMGNYF